MMICCVKLTASQAQAQSQSISIERHKLRELTAIAATANIVEAENKTLILENHALKASKTTLLEQNQNLKTRLSAAESQAEKARKEARKMRWAMGGLFVAVFTSIILKFRK